MNVYYELVGIEPKLTEYPGSVSDGTIHLPGAQSHHWKGGGTAIQEEILHTLVGTVYCYDFQIDQPTQIHLEVKAPFIQLYHMMQIKGKGTLAQQSSAQTFPLLDGRGVYLYTPTDRFTLHLERGHYLIYGFCFHPDILFAADSGKPEFIWPLLDAFQRQLPHLVASIDFKAERGTHEKHHELYDMLVQGKVCKALCILQILQKLFDLSIRKMKQIYEQHHPNRVLVDSAREMIVNHFNSMDSDISIQEIAFKLQCIPNYLSKLHITHYGININTFRKEIRLNKIKNLLLKDEKLMIVALQCGFKDYTALCKFFKQETGYTAKVFLEKFIKKSCKLLFWTLDFIVLDMFLGRIPSYL